MSDTVSVFQLGSSTVVTLPKRLGFKPGQRLSIKKTSDGVELKLDKKKSLLEILKETQGAWADMDWEEYDRREKERRKIELAATRKLRKAW